MDAQGVCISAVEIARKETKMFDTRLTQIELAARWRISHRTLEYWRSLGEGPRFIKIGRLVIYRMEDVVAFENRELSEIPADKAGD